MSDQTMTLDSFYAAVMETGKMRTADHAARTSSAATARASRTSVSHRRREGDRVFDAVFTAS